MYRPPRSGVSRTCSRSRTAVETGRLREQHVLKGRMRNRKLAMGLVATAIFGAGAAASVLPASAPADPRTLVVTLATGQTITVTVDVPPGTPVDQIKIPGVSTPIVGVSEVPQQTTPPAQTPPPPQDQQPAPAPAAPGAPPE